MGETGIIVCAVLLTTSIRENVILVVLDTKLSNLHKIFGCCFNFSPLSDLPTVEELMKPIRIDSFGVSGFDLQPLRYDFFGMD